MTRPDGFDAALTEYMPSLRKQAKFIAGENGEDLLQDAVVSMLHLADKCRMSARSVRGRNWFCAARLGTTNARHAP